MTGTDPLRWVAFLERAKKSVTDPKHQAMIDVFIEHLVAETSNQLERTMATLVPDAVYHVWGQTPIGPDAPEGSKASREQVRANYEAGMNSSRGFPRYELKTERFFVGDDGLAMDGTILAPVIGTELVAWGQELPAGTAEDDEFVVSQRLALFIPFRDGLMVGEDMYWDPKILIQKAESFDVATH
jgi:hypothetical protein